MVLRNRSQDFEFHHNLTTFFRIRDKYESDSARLSILPNEFPDAINILFAIKLRIKFEKLIYSGNNEENNACAGKIIKKECFEGQIR